MTPSLKTALFTFSLNLLTAAHYDIYILAGQSNALGRGNAATLPSYLDTTQSDVKIFHSSPDAHLTSHSWESLAPGAGYGSNAPLNDIEFGPELSFGYRMATTYPNRNIAIIKHARGGTHLYGQWSATGPRYSELKTFVARATTELTDNGDTYTMRGFLWQQGEADATNSTRAATYSANLTNLFSRVRTDFFGGQELPCTLGGLSNNQHSDITVSGTDWNKVRLAQEAAPTLSNRVAYFSTDNFVVRPTDIIHFDTDGQIAIGFGHADAMIALEAADDDNDGLSYRDEVTIGTDSSMADTDNDGQNDSIENQAGTDPLDSASLFKVNTLSRNSSNNQITITWPSKEGNLYSIESSTNLCTWTTEQTNIPADELEETTSKTLSTSEGSFFVRLNLL